MTLTTRLSAVAAVALCAAANADIVAGWTFQNSAFISSTVGSSTFTYPQTGTTTAFTGYHADARQRPPRLHAVLGVEVPSLVQRYSMEV